jgi:hypothetical protein
MPEPVVPRDIFLENAAQAFIAATSTESAEHIKPLHRYLAMRFVIEGGFDPASIMPRPPLAGAFRDGKWWLSFESSRVDEKEQVVLGALKSKRIDLVVAKAGIGPVMAVSVKGTSRAFRNLVNRTEEAIGDCANIHIMYPGLVYGFVHFLKATDPGDKGLKPNDVSLDETRDAVPAIKSYAKVLEGLTARRLVRNDYARYEAVGLALLHVGGPKAQQSLLQTFPKPGSPLSLNAFVNTLYQVYDFRYPYTYTDPSLRGLARIEWDPQSSAVRALGGTEGLSQALGYSARISAS